MGDNVIKVFLSAALLSGLAAPVYAASTQQHTWYQIDCKPSKLTPDKLYYMGSTTPLFSSKETCDQYVHNDGAVEQAPDTVAQTPKPRS
jgi:hypothetical protein